jgi:phosphoribosylanthranilate isomerase
VRATSNPRVKICCITSVEEARLALEHGARALRLVSRMPSGPGVIPEDLIAEIAATVPYADAILLDSGNPTLAVKELGGTGRVHN